jgi:hypothetical protein
MAIHKTNHVFGVVHPEFPRRQFLRLMPGPRQECRKFRQENCFDRVYNRGLFPAINTGPNGRVELIRRGFADRRGPGAIESVNRTAPGGLSFRQNAAEGRGQYGFTMAAE